MKMVLALCSASATTLAGMAYSLFDGCIDILTAEAPDCQVFHVYLAITDHAGEVAAAAHFCSSQTVLSRSSPPAATVTTRCHASRPSRSVTSPKLTLV